MLFDPEFFTQMNDVLRSVLSSPAFLAAIAAFVTAVAGIFVNYRNLKNERKKWDEEREKWRTDAKTQLQSHYLDMYLRERLRTYAPVFKTLGELRDVPDPDKMHWKKFEDHPEKLLQIADELISHLYGEAGLVMDMQTRNSLLAAFYSCQKFNKKETDLNRVIDDFYTARRRLRADIQIQDPGERTDLEAMNRSYD